MTSPVPDNEHERLASLHALRILDTASEEPYDDVVRLAATLCKTPMALVNLVDADRRWGKAVLGARACAGPRDGSFCAWTVAGDGDLYVVPDTRADPRWAGHPLVTPPDGIRFYAGAAIRTADGCALGTVCVLDHEPRRLGEGALAGLQALARQTAELLELRRRSTWLAEANAELHRLSIEDPLTRLANRTLLQDRLGHALRGRLRTADEVGVFFCDLDAFKEVNDGLGHHTGDDLLRLVAGRLADVSRGTDTVARFAGDEFVVVCPGLTDLEDIARVAARLRATVERPVRLHGTTWTPRVSIGAVLAAPGEDADAVLRRADAAMYVDKRTVA